MISFEKPIVYLITQGDLTQENFPDRKKEILQFINVAAENKVSIIQIREKRLPARLIFELTAEAVKNIQNSPTKILVNDRADIAHASGADGVHLTSKAIPTKLIRREFPKEFLIGVSTHSIEKAEQAKKEGADFATFSPIFPTVSKAKYGPPQGLKKLKEVCERLKDFPIIALGGIDERNYKSVLENGASGFAASAIAKMMAHRIPAAG